MNGKTIFNPFSKHSEKWLLVIGILSLIITLVLCNFFDIYMDSIFHYAYTDENDPPLSGILKSLLSYSIGIIVLLVLGKIYNKKTRLIDIINTVLISQIPGIFIILISKILMVQSSVSSMQKMPVKTLKNIPLPDLIIMCIFSLIILFFIAYGITLIYNGFKTSTNMKNRKQIVVFACTLLITCIICQFII